MNNPFSFDHPVEDSHGFFGRSNVVQNVLTRLEKMQDSSIIGEHRVGKTSLLHYLKDPEVIRKHGMDPEHYLFTYFDFEEADDNLDPTGFWKHLLGQLGPMLPEGDLKEETIRLCDEDEIDPFDVEDLFLEISNKNYHVAFLLDAFEKVTQATGLDLDFFSQLRSLATGQFIGLIFVTSSRQKLSELSHAGIVGSPFFNIFVTFYLKPLRREQIRAVIRETLESHDVAFDEQEITYLMELTGGHPLYLKMAASFLFDAYTGNGGASRGDRLCLTEKRFLKETNPHHERIWLNTSDDEKVLVVVLAAAVLGGKPIDAPALGELLPESASVIRTLADRGLVLDSEHTCRLFSPAFGHWALNWVFRGTGGDYAQWLAQNAPDAARLENCVDVLSRLHPDYWSILTRWLVRSGHMDHILQLLCKAGRAPAPDWYASYA